MDADLTVREKQVFDLLLLGLKSREIAVRLGISDSTVHFFTKNIYRKTGVNSKPALMRKYLLSEKDKK